MKVKDLIKLLQELDSADDLEIRVDLPAEDSEIKDVQKEGNTVWLIY